MHTAAGIWPDSARNKPVIPLGFMTQTFYSLY